MTVCIILINIFIFFITIYSGRPADIVKRFGFSMAGFQPETLVTHQFLHSGYVHLIGNIWFLWLFGANLEDMMGRIGYSIYYIVGGIFAALVFKLAAGAAGAGDPSKLIGASGAISAVMGGYFLLFPKSQVNCVFLLGWIPILFKMPALFFLGLYFIMQFTFMKLMDYSNVAYAAHVGGFAFGAGVLYLLIATRAVLVPNRERVQRGEYALVGAEDEFLGRLNAAYEKQRFDGVPELYRRLLEAAPNVVFVPETQMRAARALQQGNDPALAADAYRRLMAVAPQHPLAHRAGMEVAKILLSAYRDPQSAASYLDWVVRAAGGAGPIASEARAMLQRLGFH